MNNFINKPEITRIPNLIRNFYDRYLDFLLEGCNQIKKKRYDFSVKILPHFYIFSPKNSLIYAIQGKVPSLVISSKKIFAKLPKIMDSNLEDQIQVLDDQWRLLVTSDFTKNITDNFWSTLLSFEDDEDFTIFSSLAKFVLTVLSLLKR